MREVVSNAQYRAGQYSWFISRLGNKVLVEIFGPRFGLHESFTIESKDALEIGQQMIDVAMRGMGNVE